MPVSSTKYLRPSLFLLVGLSPVACNWRVRPYNFEKILITNLPGKFNENIIFLGKKKITKPPNNCQFMNCHQYSLKKKIKIRNLLETHSHQGISFPPKYLYFSLPASYIHFKLPHKTYNKNQQMAHFTYSILCSSH